MNDSYFFFDLGDTLIYRDTRHIDYDCALIKRLTGLDDTEIFPALQTHSASFPGIYIFGRDNDKTSSLEAQDSYDRSFFEHVCTTLGIDSKLDEIMLERIKEIRYALFPGTVEILQTLKDTGVTLGIITNGRPSRRRILDQLNITHFFEKDALYISDECGMTKSDPQLFAKIALNHPESDLFLCDDESAIIEIAQSCGWKTMYINHTQEGYLPIQKYLDEH